MSLPSPGQREGARHTHDVESEGLVRWKRHLPAAPRMLLSTQEGRVPVGSRPKLGTDTERQWKQKKMHLFPRKLGVSSLITDRIDLRQNVR